MATAFYATRISEHLSRTPEQFLLALGCCLGRTGWQQYSVGDLPREQAERLGVDLSNSQASVSLYRPAEEVFHPACLASLNGKPVTLNHPPEFVDPSNAREYTRGHIQNVRKGSEPLQSGDFPIVGDLVITDEELISRIDAGVRELSLGYSYALKRDGDKLLQTEIRGNHVAVVPQGRAGAEVRICDAADGRGHDVDPWRSQQVNYSRLQAAYDARRDRLRGA